MSNEIDGADFLGEETRTEARKIEYNLVSFLIVSLSGWC